MRKLFCKHQWKLLKWRYVRPSETSGLMVGVLCECKKCGRVSQGLIPAWKRTASMIAQREQGKYASWIDGEWEP